MRKVLVGLAVTGVAALTFAAPAHAAPGQVTHLTFRGNFASADWFVSTDTSFTDTYVNVSQSRQGNELYVDRVSGTMDANGNFTGGVDTSVDVPAGYTASIDSARLSGASVTGTGLPATTCILDAQGNPTDCTSTALDVSVTWTGEGPISRGVDNEHFKSDGFSLNYHFNGTDRAAAAVGSLDAVTLDPSTLQFADLGTAHYGKTGICIGNNC